MYFRWTISISISYCICEFSLKKIQFTPLKKSLDARASLYRHIYTEPQKNDDAYADVLVSSSRIDSDMLAANHNYFAYPYDSSRGGAFGVLKIGGKEKVGASGPLYTGYKCPVLDAAFNPFDEAIIASASEDSTLKIWKIEEENGNVKSSNILISELKGHWRKVYRLVFNNLVDSFFASFII